MVIIECQWLVLPVGEVKEGPFFVTVEEGVIKAILREKPDAEQGENAQQPHLHTHLLSPGFIDLHTHGLGKENHSMALFAHDQPVSFFRWR